MTASRPAGSIYDLGYRPYEGHRLGRGRRLLALYVFSLRAIFGLGRSALAKVFPTGLALLALAPAIVQLAIASVLPGEFEVIRPEGFFGFVQIVVALFCAVSAPEVIGRDQRNRTLPLYFSRALSRADYVLAKVGALITALMIVLLVPQLVMFLGNAVAADDVLGYLGDEIDLLPRIFGASLTIAVFMAGVSLAIASQTPRRPLATAAIVVFFVVSSAIGSVLVETTTGDVRRYSVLISSFNVLDGAVHWLFNAVPPEESELAQASLRGVYYFLTAVAYSTAALTFLFRRYLRLAV